MARKIVEFGRVGHAALSLAGVLAFGGLCRCVGTLICEKCACVGYMQIRACAVSTNISKQWRAQNFLQCVYIPTRWNYNVTWSSVFRYYLEKKKEIYTCR